MISRTRIVGDLSDLPTSAFGARSLVWWGTLGFMLIEGTGFLLAAGTYLYLRAQGVAWPPAGDPPPALAAGLTFTALIVLSELPNRWIAGRAKARDARGVRIGIVAMTLIGLVLLGVRALEFMHLNVRWDQDAYSSVLWLLMVLHTTHVLTDVADSAVLGACLFTHRISDSQFSDVNDNAVYWSFVVLTWLPIYALAYWGPRLL